MGVEQAFYQEGMAKMAQKDLPNAIAQFNLAIEADANMAEAYVQRGVAYFKLGNPSQAILDYAVAIRLQPGNPELYAHRATAYTALGHLREALADAQQVIEHRPNDADAHQLQGQLRNQLGDRDGAIAHYKRAAELYLEHKDANACRDCLLHIERLKAPLNQPSPETTAFLQAALAKAQAGHAPSALEDLDWALQIDPQDGHAYLTRGRVQALRQNWSDAIADFHRAGQQFAAKADKTMLQQAIAEIEQAKQHASRPQPMPTFRRYNAAPPASGSTTYPRNPSVQRKLLRLVGDDRRTVMRLVNQLRLKHPGYPEDWYWEKAIYDLDRDRH